jgi:hypothetical protein
MKKMLFLAIFFLHFISVCVIINAYRYEEEYQMSIVYQTDKRSGITYAYESKAYWDSEKKQSRSKRTLIGRVDPETGEIRKTDGRCRKNSPYQTVQLTEQDEILNRLKGMKISGLKQEILRLETENRELRNKLESQ